MVKMRRSPADRVAIRSTYQDLLLCSLVILRVSSAHATSHKNTGLDGKVLVGYQGWFRYPGDGSSNNDWSHWSNRRSRS